MSARTKEPSVDDLAIVQKRPGRRTRLGLEIYQGPHSQSDGQSTELVISSTVDEAMQLIVQLLNAIKEYGEKKDGLFITIRGDVIIPSASADGWAKFAREASEYEALTLRIAAEVREEMGPA